MKPAALLALAGAPKVMDLGLTYRSLADSQVDLIAGNSTDGQIEALHLVALEDDRHYFRPTQRPPSCARRPCAATPNCGRRLKNWPAR